MLKQRHLNPARLSLLIAGVLGVQLPAVQATLLSYNIVTKSGYNIGPGGATASNENSFSDPSYSGSSAEYGGYYSDPHTAGAAYGNDSGWMYSRAFGQGSTYQHYSEVTQNVLLENNTGAAQDYLYNFSITQGSLSAQNYFFSTQEEFSKASYIVDIKVNGSSVWSSAFALFTDLSGTTATFSGEMLGSHDGTSAGYYWNPYSSQLVLGSVGIGESLQLSYSIRTYAEGNHLTSCSNSGGEQNTFGSLAASDTPDCSGYGGYGYGGYGYGGYLSYAGYTYAQFGDPNGFDSTVSGFTSDNIVSSNGTVTEPGALALLGVGVSALAFRRRQKKPAH